MAFCPVCGTKQEKPADPEPECDCGCDCDCDDEDGTEE